MHSLLFCPRTDRKIVLSPTYWNQWYRAERSKLSNKADSAWGKPTSVMVEEIRKVSGDLRTKTVVILGEGDGRYSLHYALREGARVEHVDYAEGAIAGLRQAALASGALKLEPVEQQNFFYFDNRGSVCAYNIGVATYCKLSGTMGHHITEVSLVLSSGLMEYLTPDEVREVVRSCQNSTAIGGVNAIVYLAKGPGVSEIPGEHPHEPGFLESLYGKNWRFTFSGDTTREDKHIVVRPEDHEIALDRPEETHVHRIMRFVAVREK